MKRYLSFLVIFFSIILFSCSQMIQEGLESTEDPRVPEINVKQGSADIASGSGSYEVVGVKVGDLSPEIVFIIENTGTLNLNLTGALPVLLSGDNADEFGIAEQPDTVIAPGANSTFSIVFSPTSVGMKTATVTIENNDFDEFSYTFTISGNTNPICDFNARIRKGITSLTVNFEDRSEGDITSWEWDFDGDGAVDSTEQNPSYTYNNTGTFSVMLTVTGPGGFHYMVKNNYIAVTMPVETSIGTGLLNLKSIYSADMDGDGDMDVLSADYGTSPGYTGEIALWTNDGSGSFDPKDAIANPTKARKVIAADLDGVDGLDILAAFDDEIAWWPNNGDGTFGLLQSIKSNFTYAYSVYAGDIDGVNGIDLLSMSDVGDGITFWPNDGAGNFPDGNKVIIDGWAFLSACLADIDDDNDLDVVASYSGTPGHIQWYENLNGIGTSWERHIFDDSFRNATSLVAVDLDNDGDLDVLALGETGSSFDEYRIVWWENIDAQGTFGPRVTFDDDFNYPKSLFATDLDEDGDTDILGAGDSIITMWENAGSGVFTKFFINYNFPNARSVFASDMDSNGDLDIIAAGETSISWFNIKMDGWYKNIIDSTFDGANSVFPADLDGDNDIDILGSATSGSDQGIVSWWKNIGNGNFSTGSLPIEYNIDTACSVVAGDIDNDNDMDVLGTGDGGGVQLLINDNGTGIYWEKIEVNSAGSNGASNFADIDNDGDIDILETQFGSDPVYWWENSDSTGTLWTGHEITPWGGSPLSIMASDMDNDNDLDVVVAGSSGLSWWENDGTEADGYFPNGDQEYPDGCKRIIDDSFYSANCVYLVDIDGDSDIDILGSAGGSTDKIALWKNNGDRTFGSKIEIVTEFYGASSVFAADLDNDGDIDILGAAKDDDEIAWWKNTDGSGTFGSKLVIGKGFDGASSVNAVDIDGDGDVDVLGAAEDSGEIVVWENNLIDYGQ